MENICEECDKLMCLLTSYFGKFQTFSELRTSEYLLNNRNTRLNKVIFRLRSRTFDIKKTWQPWIYFDNLCVSYEIKEETMSNFHNCESYVNLPHENNWEDIKGNCIEKLYEIASIVKEEMKIESV